ncbi:thiamine pyrophosphate-dependent dehydrogenase E1 component subunit alpha [Candidatus Omnitrophota bacterium]
MKIDKKISLSLYYQLLRIRMVEESIIELYPEEEMRCPVHLCIGQEGVAAGVCANLDKKDYVLSNHRSHGHFLAKGGDLTAMMAEVYGKASGCSKGKGGSMHLIDLNVGFLGSTPIVAGIIPVAVGAALGASMKKEKKVTVCFFGDAATEEGVFSESLNFASLKKLPVIFVCENNLYSVYSPLSVRQPKERDNLAIARGYGIRVEKGDGNNVTEVYKIAGKAVRAARNGKGSSFLQFDTYRYREHCGHNFDHQLNYRSKKEFDYWSKRCPLDNFERKLIRQGMLDKDKVKRIKEKIKDEIDKAIDFAKNSSFPAKKEVFSNLYAS